MTDMSGKWILGITIYYIFFFLLVHGLTNIQLEIRATNDYNVSVSTPNIVGYPGIISASPNTSYGYCSGEAEVYVRYFGLDYADDIPCKNLNLDYSDGSLVVPTQCTNIVNCSLKNDTEWIFFSTNRTYCTGSVNQSYYNISNYTSSNVCTSPTFLYNPSNCKLFGCVWTNLSNPVVISQFTSSCSGFWDCTTQAIKNIFSAIGEFLTTIVWVMTFRADVGLGALNWVFTLIFFYIPFIMLIYAIATIWK